MDELFAVPVKGAVDDYHDAANPNDDPQIEATRRSQRARRPRRKISVTEREEQEAAAATKVEVEAPSRVKVQMVAVPTDNSSADADAAPKRRSQTQSVSGSMGSSVAFSYKDLYGSDDELDVTGRYTNSANNVIEIAHDQTDFSNRDRVSGRHRRTNTSDSGMSTSGSSGLNDSMVSVRMTTPENTNNQDSIGGLISDLQEYYNKTPKQSSDEGDERSGDQINCSENVEEMAKCDDEHQESLLKSAVESLKQLPLFRPNGAENSPDKPDHSDNDSVASPHSPLHTQTDGSTKPTGAVHNSFASDSSKNVRRSVGDIFGRLQKQISSELEVDKSSAKGAIPTNKEDVDDDTPSTNSSSCPSPDLANKSKVDDEIESMAQEAQLDVNESEGNVQPSQIIAQKNEGDPDDSSIPLTEEPERLTGIFSAALSNDENGAREQMGKDTKDVIIDQLELLAKKDSLRSVLRQKADDDASSGTPRFRPSIVEDFQAASRRESFHRKLSVEGSHADSEEISWPSPVSSLASPQNEENTSKEDEAVEDETIEMIGAENDSDSTDTQSKRSKENSIQLDLSLRKPETSTSDHGASLESIEWPSIDKSKRSCDDSAAAHKMAVTKTASARSLVQSFRRQSSMRSLKSLKATAINDTTSEKENINSTTEEAAATTDEAAENAEEGKIEDSNTEEESGANNVAEHIHRPSNASSRPSYSSSRLSSSSRSHRSSRLWGRNRRSSTGSEASMSSLESFASATNRTRSKLPSVKSQESMSSFGSVTSGLYQNQDKNDDDPDNHEEFTVSITDLNESPGNVVTYPYGVRHLSRNSCKSDTRTNDGSFDIEDFDGYSSSSGRPSMSRQHSGLANDVPLLLNSATSLISHYSTDGIEHIDPSAAESDDFDFAMEAYANGMKYGHFDVQANLSDDSENDLLLAAKAYMGLGFVRQCRGELASSFDAYVKALELCKAEIGHDDPFYANLQHACGNVLSEMERNLEASAYFRRALNFYKSRESDGVDAKVNTLFVEGMMLTTLNEEQRALKCFREGILLNQTSQRPLNLKLATVMYEMGSIYSQNGEYADSASYFNVALHIRKSNLGDSFVVARTHYSLGVTLASQEVLTNVATEAFSHLEEALRICQQEFEGDNYQTAVILHAMGVLKERKGDFLSASSWFKAERDMLISLFGKDHSSVVSISSDLGTCYYNVGKYESAKNMFQDALRVISLSEADRSLELADILYKIASCHDSLCDFDEALETFSRVKEIRVSHFGMENGLVIQTMLRIGNVLLCQGEASSALKCFGEVLGIGYASDSINPIEIANALYGRGCAQFCGYQLSDAMKSFSDSLNWKLQALGENDPGLACIFYQMAHVHLQQSENEEALLYFGEYVRLLELDPQLNLHEQAQICFTKGIIAKMNENYEAALTLYKQALQMFDTLFGGKHEKIASIHFDIGCVLSELGELKAALSHFQVCLFQRKQLLGVHVDVADVLLNMASLYTKENNFEAAANCLEDSDRIWKAKLDNSEKLLSVLMISGKRWKAIHCYQEAESNFEQALEMAITMHGQKHEVVADILLDLGELLQVISQTQQAFFCFDESIQIRSNLFGADSPSVAKAEYSKGVAHIFQEQFDEAAVCLNRALNIRREKLGPKDSAVGDTLNTIGFLQLKMGNIEGQAALDPLMEALSIRRSVGNLGKVVSTLQNILSLYRKRKDYESCIEVNSDILVTRQDDFGSTHEKVAEAWINLGNVQTSAEKFDTARASYEEALRIRTLNHGYQHRLVAQVLFKIGSLSAREAKFDDAKKFFEAYMRIRAEEEGDPDEEMAQALTLMGDLQKESGEKSKAQINWTSAIEIYQQLGYEDDHKKVMRLHERQRSLGHLIGLFAFGRKDSSRGEFSRRTSADISLADNLSVLGLKIGGDDNASVVSKLTMSEAVARRNSQVDM